MEWVSTHWADVCLIVLVLDKIVAKTPCKWDDLIFTSIKEALCLATGKKTR